MSRSRSPEQRRGGGGGRHERNEDAKLYVGNVSNNLDEDALRKEFEKFGQISDVFMPKDKETGQKRGFAFVTFVDTRDAQDAIREMDGKELDGRSLRVNKPQEGPRPAGDRGGGDRGGGGAYAPRPDYGGGGGGSSVPSYLDKAKYDRVTGDLIK